MHLDKNKSYLLLLISISILLGCSPTLRYKVLSKIFDGVPDPNMETIVASDTIDSLGNTKIPEAAITQLTPQHNFHPPYRDKECTSCHDQNRMGEFVESQPEMCFQCHDDASQKHNFSHGPAAAGYCTSCHSPHKSELENLLLRSDQQLCLDCHDLGIVSQNEIHKEIGDNSCTECHDPHSSDNRFMLQAGLCKKCHQDFTESYSFVHGPVGGDYCATCHDAHLTKKDNLLLRSGPQLCLYCHDDTQVYQGEHHKDNEEKNCMACHNPHGGEDKYILN